MAAYSVSSVAAGAAVGALLGAVGAGVGVPAAVIAATALVGLALASGLTRFDAPSSPWRVPMHWGGASAWRNGAYFGAPLGTGFLTALPGAGLYAVAAACLVLPLPVAAAVYGAFGMARSLPVVIVWAMPNRDETDELPFGAVAATRALRVTELVLLGALVPVAVIAG